VALEQDQALADLGMPTVDVVCTQAVAAFLQTNMTANVAAENTAAVAWSTLYFINRK
jgi:hypothetical protein